MGREEDIIVEEREEDDVVAGVPDSEIIKLKRSPKKLAPLIERDVLLHFTRHRCAAATAAAHARPHRGGEDLGNKSGCGVAPFLVLDLLVGHLVIGPLITACWRAAWIFLDLYFEGVPGGVGTAVCVATGVVASNVLLFASPTLDTWEESSNDDRRVTSSLIFFLVSRCYTVAAFLSSIILWKGWWGLSKCAGNDVDTGLFTLVIGLMTLVCLRSGRSAMAFPLVFQTDRRMGYFRRQTFFGPTNDIREVRFPDKRNWCQFHFIDFNTGRPSTSNS